MGTSLKMKTAALILTLMVATQANPAARGDQETNTQVHLLKDVWSLQQGNGTHNEREECTVGYIPFGTCNIGDFARCSTDIGPIMMNCWDFIHGNLEMAIPCGTSIFGMVSDCQGCACRVITCAF